jgi:hypothetical protein
MLFTVRWDKISGKVVNVLLQFSLVFLDAGYSCLDSVFVPLHSTLPK